MPQPVFILVDRSRVCFYAESVWEQFVEPVLKLEFLWAIMKDVGLNNITIIFKLKLDELESFN